MANIDLNAKTNIKFQDLPKLLKNLGDVTSLSGTSTEVKVKFHNKSAIVLDGSDFHYQNGYPVSGTVKSITFKYHDKHLLDVTGVKLDVSKFAQIAQSGNYEDVFKLIEDALGKKDYIHGGAGGDKLFGFDGDDFLYGRKGNDTLTGGHGDDSFDFSTALDAKHNVDKITDFEIYKGDNDTFRLNHAVFKDLTADHTLAKSQFKSTTDFKSVKLDSNDHIVYDKTHGDLYFDRDGSGDTYGLVKFAEVTDKTSLSHSDFFVY